MNLVPLRTVHGQLDLLGPWLAPLGLRLLMAWEFIESGWMKVQGENWFADIQGDFPLPFNLLPPDLNWTLAQGTELVAGACLLLGLGTRLAAASLLAVTVVATAAVHWPMMYEGLNGLVMGYAITDQGSGNFKLPMLFIAMLLPLLFGGAGRLSLDAWLASRSAPATGATHLHPMSLPVLLAAAAVLLGWLEPVVGGVCALAALAATAVALKRRTTRGAGGPSVRIQQ